jgi:hypothetical protein
MKEDPDNTFIYLNDDETQLLENTNKDHIVNHPIYEETIDKLDWSLPEKFWKYRTFTDICENLLGQRSSLTNHAKSFVTKAIETQAENAKIKQPVHKRTSGSKFILCPPARSKNLF